MRRSFRCSIVQLLISVDVQHFGPLAAVPEKCRGGSLVCRTDPSRSCPHSAWKGHHVQASQTFMKFILWSTEIHQSPASSAIAVFPSNHGRTSAFCDETLKGSSQLTPGLARWPLAVFRTVPPNWLSDVLESEDRLAKAATNAVLRTTTSQPLLYRYGYSTTRIFPRCELQYPYPNNPPPSYNTTHCDARIPYRPWPRLEPEPHQCLFSLISVPQYASSSATVAATTNRLPD